MALMPGSNVSFAVKAGVDRLHVREDDRERRGEYQTILDWLTQSIMVLNRVTLFADDRKGRDNGC